MNKFFYRLSRRYRTVVIGRPTTSGVDKLYSKITTHTTCGLTKELVNVKLAYVLLNYGPKYEVERQKVSQFSIKKVLLHLMSTSGTSKFSANTKNLFKEDLDKLSMFCQSIWQRRKSERKRSRPATQEATRTQVPAEKHAKLRCVITKWVLFTYLQ